MDVQYISGVVNPCINDYNVKSIYTLTWTLKLALAPNVSDFENGVTSKGPGAKEINTNKILPSLDNP